MNIRFRQTPSGRLQVSVVAMSRVGRKIRQAHFGGLGSTGIPPSPTDRIRFWDALPGKLHKLKLNIDDETRVKIRETIHARIAIPTEAEKRVVWIEDAQCNAERMADIRDAQMAEIDDYKAASAILSQAILAWEAAALASTTAAKSERERAERIGRGEAGAGDANRESGLVALGVQSREVLCALQLARIEDDVWTQLMPMVDAARRRISAEKPEVRKALGRHRPAATPH